MGYRLKDNEAFSDGVKRIVFEEVQEALENLNPTQRDKDEAIHDARVSIKKIRAVLRLIRDSLGRKYFKEEDTAYRDVAQMLSKVRDSAAVLEILDKLIAHFSYQLSIDAFASVRARLSSSRKRQRQDRKSAMTNAARLLRQSRRRIQNWPKVGHYQSLALGTKRVFKNGRKTFRYAYNKPSVVTFHEWRKEVKHLLYQTQVLRPIWGKMMKPLTAELKTLGKYLSEDHDLAILRKRVSEQLDGADNRTEIETLIALIDQRRNELELKARVLGTRIYAEKPRTFVARSEEYWQAWRSEIKHDPIVLG